MSVRKGTLPLVAVLVGALALLLGDGAAVGATAAAAGDNYTAQLVGATEVPPRTTPGSGEVAIQSSPDGQSLTYTVTVRDITNVTMGHIHVGAVGTNGDIVLPLVPTAPPGSGPRSGVIGQGTLTAAQLIGPLQGKPLGDLIAQMDAGNAYVNIHTATGASPATLAAGDIPPGEIRGQLVLAMVPSTPPSTMPAGVPNTGSGYGAQQAWQPWLAALAALLTLALAGILRVARRQS